MNLILALGSNNELGYDKSKDFRLLWKQSEDLKRFKEITDGSTLLMGYNTFLSVLKPKFIEKNPFKGRRSLVIDKKEKFSDDDLISFSTIEQAIEYYNNDLKPNYPDNELFIIGGKSIYEYVLKNKDLSSKIDKIYLTLIDTINFESNDNIISLDYDLKSFLENNFNHLISEFRLADTKNEYDYCFQIWEKKNKT